MTLAIPGDGGSATPPCASLIGFELDTGDKVDMVFDILMQGGGI